TQPGPKPLQPMTGRDPHCRKESRPRHFAVSCWTFPTGTRSTDDGPQSFRADIEFHHPRRARRIIRLRWVLRVFAEIAGAEGPQNFATTLMGARHWSFKVDARGGDRVSLCVSNHPREEIQCEKYCWEPSSWDNCFSPRVRWPGPSWISTRI